MTAYVEEGRATVHVRAAEGRGRDRCPGALVRACLWMPKTTPTMRFTVAFSCSPLPICHLLNALLLAGLVCDG